MNTKVRILSEEIEKLDRTYDDLMERLEDITEELKSLHEEVEVVDSDASLYPDEFSRNSQNRETRRKFANLEHRIRQLEENHSTDLAAVPEQEPGDLLDELDRRMRRAKRFCLFSEDLDMKKVRHLKYGASAITAIISTFAGWLAYLLTGG